MLPGFRPGVEFETGSSTVIGARKLSGRLFGRGTHLMFAPLNSDTSFLWECAAGRRGGVERADGRVTRPLVRSRNRRAAWPGWKWRAASGNGEECRKKAEVTLASPDGATNRFAVWQPESG